MQNISSWFGCFYQKENYHNINDDLTEVQKIKKEQGWSSEGDITYRRLKDWEEKYSPDRIEPRGILETYEFAQKVLIGLYEENILSRSNADGIGCHLWVLAKTSENKTGRRSMYNFFLENLPKVLGEDKKEIAALIHNAIIGSGNRVVVSKK